MVDYMFVQGVQFLTTISTKFNYRTVEALPYVNKKGAKKEDILAGINKVVNLYQSHGLIVQQINGDNEFECIRESIQPILLNITAADEHVSPVERSIRSIKDRTRCQIQSLPYTKYPRTMVIGCVIFSTKSLNNEIGMSILLSKVSPSALITGQPQQNYNEVTLLIFCEYVEVCSVGSVTNTNEERTTSAIVLYLFGNLEKDWMFLSLNTGRVLHRHQWKRLPISDWITNRVYVMATKESQQYVSSNFKYEWNKDNEDDASIADTIVSVEVSEATDDDNGEQSSAPIEIHKIADEVNEIARNADTMNIETTNEPNSQTTDSSVEAPTDEADYAEERMPDEVPSGNTVTPTDEPGLDNNDEEAVGPGNTAIETTHDDDASEAHTEANNPDKGQIDNEADGTEPKDRYNLRTRGNVDYKYMHGYGETQLMQMQQDWIKEKKRDSTVNRNSKQEQ